jgi:hypothetical protein
MLYGLLCLRGITALKQLAPYPRTEVELRDCLVGQRVMLPLSTVLSGLLLGGFLRFLRAGAVATPLEFAKAAVYRRIEVDAGCRA